jgi:peptide deformylase
MAVLRIHIYPDPVLTSPAAAVREAEFGPELLAAANDMAETMYTENGIGLAAPQVGIPKRMLVMDVADPDSGSSNLLAFVNPEVVESGGTIVWEEGCLSFPGLTVEVERAETIRVVARDPMGGPLEVEGSGLFAVCLQHEMDHLDGLTLMDRISGLRRKLALGRWERLKAELESPSADA